MFWYKIYPLLMLLLHIGFIDSLYSYGGWSDVNIFRLAVYSPCSSEEKEIIYKVFLLR